MRSVVIVGVLVFFGLGFMAAPLVRAGQGGPIPGPAQCGCGIAGDKLGTYECPGCPGTEIDEHNWCVTCCQGTVCMEQDQ
jgi:hypothetical protein